MRALADVRSRVRVPIACGERLYTVQQVKDARAIRCFTATVLFDVVFRARFD